MKIILDSNILFSALIRDSITRKLILEYEGMFLFPEYIFEEMERHKGLLVRKSGLDEKQFETLLSLLLEKVTVVPTFRIEQHRQKALELVRGIDPEDVLFIACLLQFPDSVLWSDDKRLKEIPEILVFSTKEMVEGLLK